MSPHDRPTLRLEIRLAVAVAAAMAVMAAATAAWWVSVATVAPTALTGFSVAMLRPPSPS